MVFLSSVSFVAGYFSCFGTMLAFLTLLAYSYDYSLGHACVQVQLRFFHIVPGSSSSSPPSSSSSVAGSISCPLVLFDVHLSVPCL